MILARLIYMAESQAMLLKLNLMFGARGKQKRQKGQKWAKRV
jgi:hypothetical protein